MWLACKWHPDSWHHANCTLQPCSGCSWAKWPDTTCSGAWLIMTPSVGENWCSICSCSFEKVGLGAGNNSRAAKRGQKYFLLHKKSLLMTWMQIRKVKCVFARFVFYNSETIHIPNAVEGSDQDEFKALLDCDLYWSSSCACVFF